MKFVVPVLLAQIGGYCGEICIADKRVSMWFYVIGYALLILATLLNAPDKKSPTSTRPVGGRSVRGEP